MTMFDVPHGGETIIIRNKKKQFFMKPVRAMMMKIMNWQKNLYISKRQRDKT
jgi:hypothetical protein